MKEIVGKRKGHGDKDGEVQYLAVLKRIKRTAESDEKRTASLNQQEIFIPQWHELVVLD